jgi:hypothetical protein
MTQDEQHPDVHAFTKLVCNDNKDAIDCCDLFYRYCHGIDDLLDTMEDGRPTMPKEEILSIFIMAGCLYNCPFFRKHSMTLFPVIIAITNSYADSVAWERDPLAHRRTIADVLRTVGDDFFFMIAMICGGWSHMRKVSGQIREVDYLRQHTKPDDFF